jgi:uncharacterized membrane protein YczE
VSKFNSGFALALSINASKEQPAGKIFHGTILAVFIVPFSVQQFKDSHQLSCKIQVVNPEDIYEP